MRFLVSILGAVILQIVLLAESRPPHGPNLPYAEYGLNGDADSRPGDDFGNGALIGQPQATSDRHGNPKGAIRFGVGQSLRIPDVDLTSANGTVAFWFRLDEFPQFASTLMSLSSPNGILNVSVDRDILRTAWGNGGQGIHFGRPRVKLGEWNHYMLTWSEGGKEFRVAFNGQHFRRNLLGDPDGRSFSGDLLFVSQDTFSGALDDMVISLEPFDRRAAMSLAEVDVVSDSDADGIPDAYEAGSSNYELVINGELNWREASAFANELDGYLATFASEEEWAPFDFKGGDRAFLFGGAYGGGSRGWFWETGEPWSYNVWPPSGAPILGRGVTVYSPHPGLPETHFWSATSVHNMNNFLVEFGLRSDPNDPDSDDDGINDGDEVNKHGTIPTNPDSDGDEILDGVEIANGLNPNQPDEVPQQGIVETFPALEFSIFTLRGINYQLQKSTDLEAWVDDGVPFEGFGGPSSIFVRQEGEQGFWRLLAVD